MGDSGALSLGGALAMIAIFSRNEWSLLLIGGAFVLEGLSALDFRARILTRFFRRRLQVMRFAIVKSVSRTRSSPAFSGNSFASPLRPAWMGSPPPGLWCVGIRRWICSTWCDGWLIAANLGTLSGRILASS